MRELEKMWKNVGLPVLVFSRTQEGRALVYQNDRAHDLELADAVSELLQGTEMEVERQELPAFCPVGGRVYSLVPFSWKEFEVCLFHDMNDYYQENQRILNEAVMANRAKTSFLSEMSHDIRTPMGAIIGMTEIALMQENIPTRVQECLGKIKVASGHLMSLLNEVLDMSRIESGRVQIQEEDVDIADILHEILTVVRPQAENARLHFFLEIGEMAEECLRMDGVRVKQICLNLLSNAVKFTPENGEVRMTFAIVPEGTPGKVRLRMTVSDTGIGMSRDFLSRIFVAFEREQKSTVNKIQGTGLGMAITKNLVDLMGGSITVESEVGKGTHFAVDIPFAVAEHRDEDRRLALAGRRVLLLDGNESQAKHTRQLLTSLGMEADCAKNAGEAVDLLNETAISGGEYFALLTVEKATDVELLTFLPEVRRRMGADFPILLLSENDWSQLEYIYTRAGVDAFIPLPLFYSRLQAGLYAFTQEAGQELESEEQKWSFSGSRVLLVEDNEINSEIACELLGMAGLVIETAENGKEAVERFAEKPSYYYDMILMDIQMPVMNGLESTRQIRSLPRADAAEIPIVAMTANAFVEDVKNSMDAGMNAHLAKPLDMDQVFSTLEMFLGRSGR